MQSIFDLI